MAEEQVSVEFHGCTTSNNILRIIQKSSLPSRSEAGDEPTATAVTIGLVLNRFRYSLLN